jgi:hypothetical protein
LTPIWCKTAVSVISGFAAIRSGMTGDPERDPYDFRS